MTPEGILPTEGTENRRLDYFDYDRLIVFGPTDTNCNVYDLRNDAMRYSYIDSFFEQTTCLYKPNSQSYDNYEFVTWGRSIRAKENPEYDGLFFIDKLRDKVEYLYSIEPIARNPLKNAIDRLYQRAIIQYFKELMTELSKDSKKDRPSKNRYVMIYRTDWTPGEVTYLRDLVEMSGIIDEHDHPDRLIMCSEGEAIFRYIQEPLMSDAKIIEGQRYMICHLRSITEVYFYDIKAPFSPGDEIKSVSRCYQYNESIDDQFFVGKDFIFLTTSLYLSFLLSTPSVKMTVKDLEETLINEYKTIEELLKEISSWLLVTAFENVNNPIEYFIPQELQDLYHERLNNLKEPPIEPTPQWIKDGYISLNFFDIINYIYRPACERIARHIKRISQTTNDTIDTIILVGYAIHEFYLIDLIAEECEQTTKKKVLYFPQESRHAIYSKNIIQGAIMKSLDITNIRRPKIVFNSLDRELNETQDVFVFIDFGMYETRVSYIHIQAGQILDVKNNKNIVEWPGQMIKALNFSTLDVMLIPSLPLNIGIDLKENLQVKCDVVNQSNKTMHMLQEYCSYNNQHSALSTTEYYTFEKDEYGIILLTHRNPTVKNKADSKMEDLQVATTNSNSTFTFNQMQNARNFIVTRKHISYQDFLLLYFQYFTIFLHSHIYSKTGVGKDKHQYCITHDIQEYPGGYTLTNENIRQTAIASNLISKNSPDSLTVINSAEASAVYCRRMIDTSIIKDSEAYLYFLQVQLHPDRCVLLLNTAPLLDKDDSNSKKENGELWKSVYKSAETKTNTINTMDLISEELWIHMQKNKGLLMKKCKQHQLQKRSFNSKSMQVYKRMFYNYFSTAKILGLEDSEKTHIIHICDNVQRDCCNLIINNMDLLEYAIIPSINRLASIVQSSISYQNLCKGIQIIDIFVMGKFLDCQDSLSYKFLEELLLVKMRNIPFPRVDNVVLQSMTKKTQITKITGLEFQHENADDNVNVERDSITQISLSGTEIYSIDPRNQLVERIAARTYEFVISLQSDENAVSKNQVIMIKGIPLNSMSLNEEEKINKIFISNTIEVSSFQIFLRVTEAEDTSFLFDKNMDRGIWSERYKNSNFEVLKQLEFTNNENLDLSYPIVIKTQVSQTGPYKFCVEYGKNEKKEITYVREPILLKSCHSQK